MQNDAAIYDGFEFHLVQGNLYITSETEPDTQVALSSEAVKGLVEYIYGIPEGDEPDQIKGLVRYLPN